MNYKDTGYYLDQERRVVGPSGLTEYVLDKDDRLLKAGVLTDIYLEDGMFFRTRRIFKVFGVSRRTGHQLGSDNRIRGLSSSPPWDK